MSNTWLEVCGVDEIDEEDVIRFDHDDKTFCIYHTSKGFYATDGFCTHEEEHLEYGLVTGTIIECPLHQGQFEIPTGKALGDPVCIDLRTYPVKIENERIFLGLPQ